VTTAGDRPLVVALLHRFALRLVVSGTHRLMRQALDLLAEDGRSRDPLLALCSVLCNLEAGELPKAEAALLEAERHWPMNQLRTSTSCMTRPGRSTPGRAVAGPRAPPRRAARAPGTGPAAVALGGVVAAVDQLASAPDRAAARRGLAGTVRVAYVHKVDHPVMQCRVLEAAHAAVTGDYRTMSTVAGAALSSAAANGWLRSVWAGSANAMLAYAALLRAEPWRGIAVRRAGSAG
jgi:LuxR family maltose regulon positive regulatory protein